MKLERLVVTVESWSPQSGELAFFQTLATGGFSVAVRHGPCSVRTRMCLDAEARKRENLGFVWVAWCGLSVRTAGGLLSLALRCSADSTRHA